MSVKSFASLSPALRAAVNAFDDARRAAYPAGNEPPMSDANKAHIAPMILAAVQAYAPAPAQSGRVLDLAA